MENPCSIPQNDNNQMMKWEVNFVPGADDDRFSVLSDSQCGCKPLHLHSDRTHADGKFSEYAPDPAVSAVRGKGYLKTGLPHLT
ncbi:hypothetical protein AVEN_51676-1 [Araneus ventricosus]|uniref:Uncharacterized protein n=1 Tax=Araneus ventricosus TaxID=182803 RepID=A0A4Y2IH48_ARAVE|nr:hypothetical protein AVEN_51676-1 [Araneus ventricosus]